MKRWIIRSFFIGLLLFFVTLAVVSHNHLFNLQYARPGLVMGIASRGPVISIDYCSGDIGESHYVGSCRLTTHLEYFQDSVSPEPLFAGPDTSFGFHWECRDQRPAPSLIISIFYVTAPHWCFVLVSSAVLFVVWRKTQPRANGGAFPVELANPKAES